jgi:hypothetical protein
MSKLFEQARKGAIRSWTDALNGKFGWYNDYTKRCSKNEIKINIEYFKNLKR